MKYSEHTVLMHAVLDGEATPGETADLTRLLAADPASRAEFEDLQRLFESLKSMPRPFPPEGLVYSVMEALPAHGPQRPTRFGGVRQLFSRSRVIGTTGEHSTEAPGANPGKSATVHPISQRGPHFKGEKNMSEQNTSSVGNRKIWIGAGVAAAAVIVAVATGVLPPSGKDTAGTIVPAQRFRAPQMTAADVKLDGAAGTQTGQPTSVGVQGSADVRAASDGAARAASDGAARAASDGAARAASDGAARAASDGAARAASDGAARAASDGAARAASDGAARAASDGAARAASNGAARAASDGAARAASDGAARAASDAVSKK